MFYYLQENIESCETCRKDLCQNNGVCQEEFVEKGYKCICPSGFSGELCEDTGEACYPGLYNLLPNQYHWISKKIFFHFVIFIFYDNIIVNVYWSCLKTLRCLWKRKMCQQAWRIWLFLSIWKDRSKLWAGSNHIGTFI